MASPKTKQTPKPVNLIDKLVPLLNEQWRYKVMYGGRGGGKSLNVIYALIVLACTSRKRILCAREVQKSIKESVYAQIEEVINELGLTNDFSMTQTEIVHKNGSQFIFSGLADTKSLKSMSGVDIVWIEEANGVQKKSMDDLRNTIRKEGSEIWMTFNPEFESDYIYQAFVIKKPDNCWLCKINYSDNAWFPAVLEAERLNCWKNDRKNYEHIWLGGFKTAGDEGDFLSDWVKKHEGISPGNAMGMTKYIVVDPARVKNENADFTAMAVIGLNADGNYYVLEVLRDKLRLEERYSELTRLYRSWDVNHVYYKRTGVENEIEAMELFQARDNFRYNIKPLKEPINENGKAGRIRRLIPDMQAGRWFFPRTQWRKMWDNENRDMMQDFIQQELLQFPNGEHDDFLDCLSGIYDIAVQWPTDVQRSAIGVRTGVKSWVDQSIEG